MSNKHRAIIVIVSLSGDQSLEKLSSPHLDDLIATGNSSLLVLRKHQRHPVTDVFEAVTSLSQLRKSGSG
jgi:hypothetical protein